MGRWGARVPAEVRAIVNHVAREGGTPLVGADGVIRELQARGHRGVRYRALGAAALLRRHLLVYGVGGLLAPFLGIKAIDVMLVALGVV